MMKFYTDSARNSSQNILLELGRGYNKNTFKKEIKNFESITDDELRQQKMMIREQEKDNIPKINSLNFTLEEKIQEINGIISFRIEKPKVIKGINSEIKVTEGTSLKGCF